MEDKKLVILDVELACINTPKIVEVSLLSLINKKVVSGESFTTVLINPEVEIAPDASSVHNITNSMVSEKPTFKDHFVSDMISRLNDQDNYFLTVTDKINKYINLSSEGKIEKLNKTINIKKALSNLLDDQKIYKLSLHALRYHLDVNNAVMFYMQYFKVLDQTEHYAFISRSKLDSIIILSLYQKYLSDLSLDELYKLSRTIKLLTTIDFGKYAKKTFMEVVLEDKQYLEWLYKEKLKSAANEGIDKDTDVLILTIKHYLDEGYLDNPKGIIVV